MHNTDRADRRRPTAAAWRRPSHRATLLVGWAVALAMTATTCRVALTPEDAADLLQTQLWSEDAAVFGICRDLQSTDPGELLGSTQLSETSRRELVREAVEHLQSLLLALDVSLEACPPAALIARSVAASGGDLAGTGYETAASASFSAARCGERIEAAFAQLDSDLGAGDGLSGAPGWRGDEDPVARGRVRLYAALRRSGVDTRSFLDDPIATARLVDLSPAVVYSVVYFADRIDGYVDDLVSGFGFVKGLVGLVLEEAAAELLAVTTEHVLDELEADTLINRASISRSACGLYSGGGTRPRVTVRLLKRLVLRMQPVEAGGYTVDAICDALADDGVCEEMADEIGLDSDALLPGGAEGRHRYAGLRPQLTDGAADQAATTTVDRSQMLLRSALFCGSNCTMGDINRGASALLLAESRSEELPAAAAPGYSDQITAGLHTDVEALRADLRHIRAELTVAHSTLAGMANLLRQNELSANRMRRDLINTLARLSDCRLELDAVRQARIDFVRDVLRVDQPLDCDAPAPFYTTDTFPGVRIPGAVVCNPMQPFDFDIATDGLFATCEANPDREWLSRLAPLAAAAAQLEPQSLLIIGHADERPVRTEACVTRYGNNTLLSEARAEAIASLFRTELSGVAPELHIETTGFGDVAPRVQCGPDAPDSCHRLNRRVTIRPVGAQGVEFDFACAGGRR